MRKHRAVVWMNAVFITILVIIFENFGGLSAIYNPLSLAGVPTSVGAILASLVLAVFAWIISNIAVYLYDNVGFKLLGLGGSKRGTYVYAANQSEPGDSGSEYRILGVFFVEDSPGSAEVTYAEAYYWNDDNTFSRRSNWESAFVDTRQPGSVEMIYKIGTLVNQAGIPSDPNEYWTGIFRMKRRVTKKQALVVGFEGWRGVAEGRRYSSNFYAERVTKNKFLSAREIINQLKDDNLLQGLREKLPYT